MTSLRTTPAPTAGTRQQSRLRNSSIQHVDPSLRPSTRQSQRVPLRADTPQDAFSHNIDYVRTNVNVLPPLQHWSFSRSHSPIKQESVSSEYSDGSYEIAPQPTTRRRRAQGHRMSGSNASVYDDNGVEELVNDINKLKGTIWPGMDMFDSATPEMRRKRNQKKHGSVLLLLQATSEETEALEMVFRDGNLAKERTITGNPESDDSLISGESEPEPDVADKKPVRRRPRAPLAEKNINTGRVLRKKERGGARHRPSSRTTKGSHPDPDEEEEVEMTYRPKKTRTGLSIHRDNSGPDITFSQQPSSMNYLNSGFDGRPRQDPLRQQTPVSSDFAQHYNQLNTETFTPRTHFRQPSHSWGQVNVGFRPVGFSGSNMPSSSTSHFAPYNSHTTTMPHTRSSLSQQYFGQSTVITNNDNPLFQPHQSTNDPHSWDHEMFEFSNPDLGMPDMTFHSTGEVSNPLFFSGKSDDEATISAAESDH